MAKKYLSRWFNVSASGAEASATLLVPYKSANIIRIELTGDAFQTAADPEVLIQVALRPDAAQNNQVFDGMLAYIAMGGTRTTDVGLSRMDFAKVFEIPPCPVAIGQSVYMRINASACNAGVYAIVWFDVIRP